MPWRGKGKRQNRAACQDLIFRTNVARASLEELLIDFEDFLRTQKLPRWQKDHRLVDRLRELNKTPNANYATFQKAIEHESPEICANTMITLITITTYLLKQQLKSLETPPSSTKAAFVKD